MSYKIILTATLGLCTLSLAAAPPNKNKLKVDLANVPVVELPARAAELVKSSEAQWRDQTAASVIEIVLQRHPAAASAVVSAIAKAAPSSSATAAAAAIQLSPGNARHIQLAAQTAAPEQTKEIATAVENLTRQAAGGNGQGNGNAGGNENGNHPGNGNPQGPENPNGQGGVGHGPPPNPSQGRVEISNRPIQETLPNGKPRHFPPDPPRRPVDPPRPIKYNRPQH